MGNGGSKPGEELEVKERQKTESPRLYKVFLLNGDYTTMDFVVHVLESVFRKSPVEATRIMLHVHKKGRGLAGVFTREIAETKIAEVHSMAHDHEYPLRCEMERE